MSKTKKMKAEKLEAEKLEATRLRVEEAKKIYLERKSKYKGKSLQITRELLEGIDTHDTVYVKLINGEIGELVIRPLAEGEVIEIFSEVGFDRIEELGQGDFAIEDYEFFWSVVSISTGIPKDLIKKTFAIGESALVGNKILELSGFAEDVPEEIESFPEK